MGELASVGMGNVLEKSKQEQVIALGRLGWSLRRIEEATGGRRGRAGGCLRFSGDSITYAGRLGTLFSGKTGHRSDHRLFRFQASSQFKTGHRGDHRLFALRDTAGAGWQADGRSQ